MLTRVSGGSSGIKEYLERGHKQGRDFERDELDQRVILEGDLELTDSIINSMSREGDKYLHITLSFKEDEVSPEMMKGIVGEFKEFAMTAFGEDEYNFYAEAHYPRVKSYVNQESGDFVERKPHVHIVIPQQNLLSGNVLNPFGLVEHQTKFIDAFQEHINAKYGLASPKDNRRTELTDESTIISRYKGDHFKGNNQELKNGILDAVLERGIENYEDFKNLANEFGKTKTRAPGGESEYLNVKPEGAAKGVNLKEYVFSREFIELPTEQKRAKLAAESRSEYETPGTARNTAQPHAERLTEWHELRAKEVKYVKSGNKRFYAEYKAADREHKKALLDECADRFYSKHRKDEHHAPGRTELRGTGRSSILRADERGTGPAAGAGIGTPGAAPIRGASDHRRVIADIAENLRAASHNLESTGRSVGHADEARRNLDDRRIARVVGALVAGRAGDQRTPAREQRAAEQPAPGRSHPASVIDQHAAELGEKRAQASSTNAEFAEIKQRLDARRLLDGLSKTHGVQPEKYPVSKGKDGSDRIKCGTRNLNVSDFLTAEMRLPWKDAAQILKQTYAAQRGQEVTRRAGPPRAELWKEYRATWPAKEAERREQALSAQKASERERRAAIKAEYDKQRRAIDATKRKPAEKKAERSAARMVRVQAEMALRATIKRERDELRAGQRRPYAEQYREFLTEKAQAGSEAALHELRRQRAEPEREDTTQPRFQPPSASQPPQAAPLASAPLRYTVARNGDVTYHDRTGRAVIQDTSREVRLMQRDAGNIEAGLRLAVQKYGQKLEVKGDDEFKRRTVEVAAAAGLKVEFTDPAMNAYRAELAEKQRMGREFLEAQRQEATKRAEKPAQRPAEAPSQDNAQPSKYPDAEPAKDGARYTGEVIGHDERHVYQRAGRQTIQHQKAKLDEVPAIGETKRITYHQGRAQVKDTGRDMGR